MTPVRITSECRLPLCRPLLGGLVEAIGVLGPVKVEKRVKMFIHLPGH